jgi:hypothetical protein
MFLPNSLGLPTVIVTGHLEPLDCGSSCCFSSEVFDPAPPVEYRVFF